MIKPIPLAFSTLESNNSNTSQDNITKKLELLEKAKENLFVLGSVQQALAAYFDQVLSTDTNNSLTLIGKGYSLSKLDKPKDDKIFLVQS